MAALRLLRRPLHGRVDDRHLRNILPENALCFLRLGMSVTKYTCIFPIISEFWRSILTGFRAFASLSAMLRAKIFR